MFKLWSRGIRFQMIVIVSVLLLVSVLFMTADMLFYSKADDVLIKDLEKKITGTVQSLSKQMTEQLSTQILLEGEPGQNLPSALEKSFKDIARNHAENYKGVRLGIYIVNQDQIFIEGFLHDFRPPGGEGEKQREQRIYQETSAGIKAVVSGGIPITKLGQTWDDQFIEYLAPIHLNSKLVAVVWAEERVHPIFAQNARTRYILRLVILITFCFGIGATLLSTISLVKRVNKIKDGLANMEKDFSNTLPEMTGDMGQITNAINKMASGLKEKEALSEQLRISQNLASLGRLVTDIAHELRNPICILQCTADLLEPKVKHNPELNECVFMFQEQLKRLNLLTEELLDFGRPMPIKRGTLDLRILLESLIETIIPLLQKNEITLNFSNPENLPNIIGNKEKLKQVFLNLFFNAIQAMPKAGVLTIQTFAKEKLICVVVNDTGEGISQEDQSKIFQPFFTRKTDGNGLGLAICKKIIEYHGGSITVESQPGVFTTFTVCFPIN